MFHRTKELTSSGDTWEDMQSKPVGSECFTVREQHGKSATKAKVTFFFLNT